MKYFIAFLMESGEFDIVSEIEAADDDDAEAQAESSFPGTEWYVLDTRKRNINE